MRAKGDSEMKRGFLEVLSHAKAWGMSLINASPTAPKERILEVYRQTMVEVVLVGRLSCEQDEYIFRYEPSYTGEPISAFPRKDEEYRSKYLWPFFAICIPPLDREDMREEIATRSLREDQIIEILGSVATVSVSNPYEFRLESGLQD